MSRCSIARPAPRKSAARVASACAARWSGSSSVICEPTWLCSPTISTPRAAVHAQAHRPRVLDRDPELVVLAAGRDVRVAAGVDVGVDPDARRGRGFRAPRAMASIRSSSPSDSALMLRRPRSIARVELGVGLADAGEDDLGGREAGPQRHFDFPAGIGIGGGAERCAAGGQWPASSWPSARSAACAGSRRTPRRPRGGGPRSSRRCRRRAVCRSGRQGPRAGRRRRAAHPAAVQMKTRSFDSTVPRAELGTQADVWVGSFLILFRPTPEADDGCCQPRSPRNSVLRGEARCRLTRPRPSNRSRPTR